MEIWIGVSNSAMAKLDEDGRLEVCDHPGDAEGVGQVLRIWTEGADSVTALTSGPWSELRKLSTAALAALDIKVEPVPAFAWQADVIGPDETTRDAATRLYPSLGLFHDEAHGGRAIAAILATFGRFFFRPVSVKDT